MRWILVALLPSVAAADAPEGSLERVMYGRGGYASKLDMHAELSVAGRAGRDTDVQTRGAGELAWTVGRCRALFAGAAGAYDKAWSGSVYGGICPPFPQFSLEVTIRADYQLQPSFAALPIGLRSRFQGIAADVAAAILIDDDGAIDHETFVIHTSVGVLEQPMLDTETMRTNLTLYRWHDTATGRQIAAVPMALGTVYASDRAVVAPSSLAVNVSPVGFTKWPLGELRGWTLEADAAIGVAYGGIHISSADPMARATALLTEYDVHADLAVRARRDADVFALTARRAFEPTMIDHVLLDTRAEASWQRTFGATTLAAAAFVARTDRYDDGGLIDATPTGGARAAYVRRLGPAQLALAVEAAHSFFAKLDGTLALDAAWAAQTSATISIAR